MISLKEIARQCGVSVITVSRALDPLKKDKVKLATRQKIEALCAKENFYPSYAARALASGCTKSIGLLIPGIGMIANSPPSAIYLEALNDELQKHNYSLQLMPVHGDNWESIKKNALPLILSNRCDGYICVAFSVDLPSNTPITVLQTTAAQIIEDTKFPVISIDSNKAMDLIAQQLKEANYKKPLMVLFGDNQIERKSQWQKAFNNNNFSTFNELILPSSRIGHKGDVAMLKVLEANFDKIKDYDIWVFSNDHWALLGLELLYKRNLSPGKDIALIGFDNIEEKLDDAILTSISPPLEEFGKEAAKMVLKRLKEKNSNFQGIRVELNSKPIFRLTTSKNQGKSPL
jgi:LacI family transcriptional regulator